MIPAVEDRWIGEMKTTILAITAIVTVLGFVVVVPTMETHASKHNI